MSRSELYELKKKIKKNFTPTLLKKHFNIFKKFQVFFICNFISGILNKFLKYLFIKIMINKIYITATI